MTLSIPSTRPVLCLFYPLYRTTPGPSPHSITLHYKAQAWLGRFLPSAELSALL